MLQKLNGCLNGGWGWAEPVKALNVKRWLCTFQSVTHFEPQALTHFKSYCITTQQTPCRMNARRRTWAEPHVSFFSCNLQMKTENCPWCCINRHWGIWVLANACWRESSVIKLLSLQFYILNILPLKFHNSEFKLWIVILISEFPKTLTCSCYWNGVFTCGLRRLPYWPDWSVLIRSNTPLPAVDTTLRSWHSVARGNTSSCKWDPSGWTTQSGILCSFFTGIVAKFGLKRYAK